MNIIEAAKSGKNYRRPGLAWILGDHDGYLKVTLQYVDIIADDWEIEERKVEITELQAHSAYYLMKQYFDVLGNDHIESDAWAAFRKTLGFK